MTDITDETFPEDKSTQLAEQQRTQGLWEVELNTDLRNLREISCEFNTSRAVICLRDCNLIRSEMSRGRLCHTAAAFVRHSNTLDEYNVMCMCLQPQVPSKPCAWAMYSSVASPAVQYFPTFYHKRHNFLKRENLLNIKCVFLFSLHLLSDTPLIIRTKRDIIINV